MNIAQSVSDPGAISGAAAAGDGVAVSSAALPDCAPAARAKSALRFHGIDALRGVAALLVMLFHYTTRYDEKFGHVTPALFSVPWGYLGVYLFFMISGFVIFMTLERSSQPQDFVVSRFSRLYPAYWVAVLITFCTVSLSSELGESASARDALANLLMFHGLFGVEHIDGVYWTLEVELLFYWAMLLVWLAGGFAAPWRWIGPWLLLCLASAISGELGVRFPFVVTRVLILDYFPYFALGCIQYLSLVRGSFRWRTEGALGALALLVIGLNDTGWHIAWALLFIVLFRLVMRGWASSPPVVALAKVGLFSYPIYLLHETLGWTLIHRMEAAGTGSNAAIVLASAVVLALAYLLHKAVEMPAMRAIRRRWLATERRGASRQAWVVGTLLAGVAVLAGSRLALHL